MPKTTQRVVSTEEVRRLTSGSFEHLITRLDAALVESSIFEGNARVVGTFPDHAVVLTEAGDFYRVPYSWDGGMVKVGPPSLVPTAKARTSVDGVRRAQAADVAEALARGDKAGAMVATRALVASMKAPEDQKIVENMISAARTPRLWKRIFAEKAIQIREKVLDEITAITEDRVQPKFRPLYDGSLSATERERYRNLVIEGLQRIEKLSTSLCSEVEWELSVLGALGAKDPVVTSLIAFSEDLRADLATSAKFARDGISLAHRIDHLGQLHDVLAEDLHDKRVAGRFVIKMSRRLGEAI